MKLKIYSPFHCPEGKWRGVCEAVDEPKKLAKKPCAVQVRLRFCVITDEGDRQVARTFCADLGVGGELYTFLASMLDGDFEKIIGDNGDVDLDLLVGMKCDLHIVHGSHGKQYEYPVVNIVGVYPCGRLTDS